MPRKLCYVCEATQGGVRKHLFQLLRAFGRPEEGFELHAILGDRGEPGFREELSEMERSVGLTVRFVEPLSREIRLNRDVRAYMQIKEIMRSIAPAIVHTHSSKAGILGRQAAFQLDVKNILHTPHVFPFQWSSGLKRRVFLGMERHAARQCRKILCVGESQRADAIEQRVAPAEKLEVVRNGIELPELPVASERERLRAELGLAADKPVIGMVARLAPQKGVGIFVRAAASVAKKHPEVVFVVVGGGPLEPEMKARAAELQLTPERFRFLGHRQDAERLYPAFDIVALSSLYEGLPYVLLEAMSWGVPVVATDVLGSRDVVADGETGFLAKPNDPAHIASRICVLLEDRPFLRRCAEAARKRVQEEFSLQAFLEGHRRAYNEA
ncbi:MAG TPA: glycosyltransferase family 4 protein [Planctomycetota bacterium]|nr:glycosyltransferase family 4 protein [Planctomycetota bacterium]